MGEHVIGIALARAKLEGKVGLDIGANHGCYTGPMAAKCKEVFAFEPAEGNLKILREIVRENVGNLPNITVVPAAVSDYTGTGKLYNCTTNDGGHTVALSVASNPVYSHKLDDFWEVPFTTLDDYFPDRTDIGFIKIDVEANEEYVLKGADKLLDRNKVVLVIELHQTIKKDRIFDFMINKGYLFYDHEMKLVGQAKDLVLDCHYIIHNLGDDF